MSKVDLGSESIRKRKKIIKIPGHSSIPKINVFKVSVGNTQIFLVILTSIFVFENSVRNIA